MSHKTRDIIFGLVLILVMVGLLVWYLLARPHAALPVGNVATSTPSSTVSIANVSTPPQHITESGTYYDADLEYPAVTPLAKSAGASADAAAIATIKAYDESTIATFKKDSDVADITPQVAADEGLGGDNKYELSSTYQTYTSPFSVTYVFTVVEDTLGAHPNSYYQTFTFRATDGTQLQLSDLFNTGTSYLNTLSTLTRASLTTKEGSSSASFIDPGTTPVATNFASFAIDGNDLVIFFAPYTVAPYSSGPQTVHIPLTELSSVLKSSYQ
jgi:hypothetical protein